MGTRTVRAFSVPWVLHCWALLMALLVSNSAQAYKPESPEVRRVIDKGIKFLSTQTDRRLGGVCLIGLAFVKDDQPDHPKVAEALAACRAAKASGNPRDVYSNGIALIFLCELDAKRHRDLIDFFAGTLKARQKDHGGWGYNARKEGDTSQTQYGTLGVWELHQHHISIDQDAIATCLDWVIHTQDPSGAWGYQGKVAEKGQRTKQDAVRPSMVAAGLSSLLVCADLYGLLRPGAAAAPESGYSAPAGFREAERKRDSGRPRPIPARNVDRDALYKAIRDGQDWFKDNFTLRVDEWNMYYLYSIERYKSFEELLTADVEEEPAWYNDAFRLLSKTQKADGSWNLSNGAEQIETAFAVLFLLRSTKKSLRPSLGEGVMLSGRGAPVELARKKGLNPGGVLINTTSTRLSDMLAMLDDGEADKLDAIAADPTAFIGGEVDETTARRLQQLVRGGEPAARLLAVRSLGRTGKLDFAPTLLFALTDPDRRVVLEARDALRLLSRRFEGFGLPNNYNERQKYEALDKWKRWYLTFRPDAVLDF